MSELILGNHDIPRTVCIVDRYGKEVEISVEDIWAYQPDASGESYEIMDLAALPTDEWRQGEQDD